MAEHGESIVRDPLPSRAGLVDLVLERQAPVSKGGSWR
jgi:hypothetical protein